MPYRTRTRRLALASAAALIVAAGTVAANGTVDSRDQARDQARGPAHGHADGQAKGHGKHHGRSGVERVALQGADGSRVGHVTLRQRRGAVVVSVSARGLTPGFHGFHIHTTGLCEADAPDGPFTTAGGHYTGGGGSTAHGDHAGDLPSLLVTEDGRAWAMFVTDRFTLRELRAGDGSAVMVHEGPDNFANIPDRYTSGGVAGPDAATLATGDAGGRVACGVID